MMEQVSGYVYVQARLGVTGARTDLSDRTEETLARLGSRQTFWTATHGHTVFVSDGQHVEVRTQRAAPTEPARLRAADPVAVGTTDPVESRVTLGGTGAVATPTPAPAGTPTEDGSTTGVDQTTAADGGSLVIETINADAAGVETENLNDEYVTFRNTGDEPLDLSGYTVADAAGRTHTFTDGVVIEPGATLTLHTGSGVGTTTDRYWNASRPVWNNDGDTVILTAPDGTVVVEVTYG